MSKLTAGIIDYGVGNHASVRHCLYGLDLRCRVSADTKVLEACDLLVLPGVGAFRPAIKALREKKLDGFVVEQSRASKPMLGICLGMQLLTEASHEDGKTTGLGLIPGEAVPLQEPRWHIGWNTIELVADDPMFEHPRDQAFFFNHSYAYQGPLEFQRGVTTAGQRFASIIRRDRTVGVQFHPEKSQDAGAALLKQIVEGLCDA